MNGTTLFVPVAKNGGLFGSSAQKYYICIMKKTLATGLLLCAWNVFLIYGQTARRDSAAVYNSYIRQADSCYMQRNYPLSSAFFSKAFAERIKPMGNHLYNGACAAALAGDTTQALDRLFARARLYPQWYSDLSDNDLKVLHSCSHWQILCDTMQARKAFFERNFDHQLKNRLDSIHYRDQMPRHAYLAALREAPKDRALIQSRLREMQRNDSINQIEVFDILDTYGWPSSKIVGGSNFALWEVIQHASLEAIEKYLPLFHAAATNNELNKSFVAMMEDRCDMWRNRPQKYGTQGTRNENGEFVIHPLLDPGKVDKWRAEMGLPPLSEYIRQMNKK